MAPSTKGNSAAPAGKQSAGKQRTKTPLQSQTPAASVGSISRKPAASAGAVKKHLLKQEHAAEAPRKLRIGSHCSGWLSESQALENLGIPHNIAFACDSNPAVKKLIARNFNTIFWQDDMLDIDAKEFPQNIDLYSCGFPCQPWSSAGLRKGLHDDRSLPIHAMLEYIKTATPKMFILENVAAFARHKKGADSTPLEATVRWLRSLGVYTVFHKLLNTADFGIPQDRKRIYIVGIQTRLIRLPFQWPDRVPAAPLSKFWDRNAAGRIAKVPDIPERILRNKTSWKNLSQGWKKLVAKGLMPEDTEAVIDIGAGKGYGSVKVGQCPTLTNGRASSFGYFSVKNKRQLSLAEMMRLQGADPKRINMSMISKTQAGAIIGNAMSVNVMEGVIVSIMQAVGGPNALPFK